MDTKEKIWWQRGEVLEATGWTGYFLDQLVEAGALKAFQWKKGGNGKKGANRRYKRERVLAVLREM